MFLDFLTIIQILVIFLGFGASVLAITNFCVAVADGVIDEHERRMMGVVYVVLRIAMVAILFSTLAISVTRYTSGLPWLPQLTQIWTLLAILFVNATLMTLHKLPSAFGPAIQVSAWFTLAITTAFSFVSWQLSFLQFLLFYVTLLFFAIATLNSFLVFIKLGKHE